MRSTRARTLAVATVAAGLLAGGITAGTTDVFTSDKPAETIVANAAAEQAKNPSGKGGDPDGAELAVKGLKLTLGDRSVKLSWDKVRGADGYRVYADYSCDNSPRSTSTYQRLKKQVDRTSWTHENIQRTCVNYAVVALHDGAEGPRPLLGERALIFKANRHFAEAAQRFFTSAPAPGDQVARTSVAPGEDRGIVLARAYIRNNSFFNDAIGDHRSWTSKPSASSKITFAWNTGTGQVAAYAQKSCFVGATTQDGPIETACLGALPLVFGKHAASAPDDLRSDARNFISVSRNASGGLSFGLGAQNSWGSLCISNSCFGPDFGRINGALTLTPQGKTFAASLTADKFPAWEIIRYPRLIQGAPGDEARVIGTRDQTSISDLRSGQQSTCTSKGEETLEVTNPMAC
ncbi:hypothetical protein ACFQ7W_19155 [Streptomyces niveus]|uniref:hypothetical protein n=1 Tax=Streptomyces niveus TaxID=193462 RepID=UPI003686B899